MRRIFQRPTRATALTSTGACGERHPADGREQRYTNEPEKHFDWFLKADFLLPIFDELTADAGGKEARILMLGCGNSRLGEVMYDAGWKNIVNIDVSAVSPL